LGLFNDLIRGCRQIVADRIQLSLLRLHLLDCVQQRLRHFLRIGDIRLESGIKLSAFLRQRRLCGVAESGNGFTGGFAIFLGRSLVVIVGITKYAAAHPFEVVLDLQCPCSVVRQRIHFHDIGLDAVEFRDGIDG
jgi:hypothetical protein